MSVVVFAFNKACSGSQILKAVRFLMQYYKDESEGYANARIEIDCTQTEALGQALVQM